MDDAAGSPVVFGTDVSPSTAPRIAIAASPPLLAASLASLLADVNASIVVVDAPTTSGFDLALVTGDGPRVSAETSIVLDNGPRGVAVAYVTDLAGPGVLLEGLPAIVDFVRAWVDARRQVILSGG
jgi:hypothetical protein